jgi:hypothetical protein
MGDRFKKAPADAIWRRVHREIGWWRAANRRFLENINKIGIISTFFVVIKSLLKKIY